ncbi:MAG: sulfite exporter TauE/SafE family protein [Deltaproteobacteria bacterium]|nr:sulfite exporter TauE/SafE family protein [Deltaproteobacteria bacterium]
MGVRRSASSLDHERTAWRSWCRKLWTCLLLCLISLSYSLIQPRSAFAHPMGNFSINRFSGLEVHPTFVRVSYVLDMAEIPTFQEMQEQGLNAQSEDLDVTDYGERKVEELRNGLDLRVGGQPLTLTTKTRVLSFPPGAGGLPTLRLSAVYEAPLAALSGEITYEDRNYPQRVGWKEIVATGQVGVTLRNVSVPMESKSRQLTAYAENLLQTPPQDLRATLTFDIPAAVRAAAPAVVGNPVPERTDVQTPRTMLTELMTAGQLSTSVILFALLVAVGLGAFHALEPGHGKTLVAAYLVGSRGTAWHALILGLTVTVSHTIGVYALGGVALFASHYILPEQLYPWLGLTSGLLIVGTGLFLFGRALEGQHEHSEHAHPHHPHTHEHEHAHGHEHEHEHEYDVGYGALLTLGITGGLIPCPAALVVLLSAVALQRIAFGLLLIVAFSVGLALVLVSVGLLLVSARGMVQRWSGEGRWTEYLPFLSPLVITPLGVVIAVRSLMGTGILGGLAF